MEVYGLGDMITGAYELEKNALETRERTTAAGAAARPVAAAAAAAGGAPVVVVAAAAHPAVLPLALEKSCSPVMSELSIIALCFIFNDILNTYRLVLLPLLCCFSGINALDSTSCGMMTHWMSKTIKLTIKNYQIDSCEDTLVLRARCSHLKCLRWTVT